MVIDSGDVDALLGQQNAVTKEQLSRDAGVSRRRQFGALGHALNGVAQYTRFQDNTLALLLQYHSHDRGVRYEELWNLIRIAPDGTISIESHSNAQEAMDSLLEEGGA